MFFLSENPVDPEAQKQTLEDATAGACATFEGWVRDHNEGRSVHRLEYEAYPALAIAEGKRIIEEAIQKFAITRAVCTHRVGALAIGDCAVWVGVCSSHRAESFAACRYIIDEVKHRVPIWKKEHYTDGDSGWVNCERCADHAHDHTSDALTEADFYARQTNLSEVGAIGQQRLKAARVLVVGAGGLGCSALQYLAAAGVGTLAICEPDALEASNLHRQPLYTPADLGRPKATQAAERLRAQNPFITIEAHPDPFTRENAARLLPLYDTILDCTDNFEAKFLLNDMAVAHKKRLIQASIYQYEGQLFVYDPEAKGPCLRCIWPEMPAPGCVRSCAEAGVLGAVPGVFGGLQAAEALKQIIGLPGKLTGETVFFDLLSYRSRKVRAERRPACPVCQGDTTESAHIATDDLELALDPFDEAPTRYTIVDIREAHEADAEPLGDIPHLKMPATTIKLEELPLDRGTAYLFCCSRGMRSRYLAMRLREAGYTQAHSLRGGLNAVRRPLR